MGDLNELFKIIILILFIIINIIFSIICIYKYAICQKEKSIISVIPRQYSNLESKHNSGVGIIVTPQNTAICSSV